VDTERYIEILVTSMTECNKGKRQRDCFDCKQTVRQ